MSCHKPTPTSNTLLTPKQHHNRCFTAMSTLGSSLKRSFTPSQIMRPNMPRRTLSGSSHGSCPSPSPLSDEQFAFSAGNTPVRDIPPSYVASAGYNSMTGTPRDALLLGTRGKFVLFWNFSIITSDPSTHFPEVSDENDAAPMMLREFHSMPCFLLVRWAVLGS